MEALTTAPVTETPAQEQTKPMKLSEAIRLGAMSTKQTFGTWGDISETCAIGAAQVALGIPPGEHDHLNDLLKRGPFVTPPCGHHARSVGDAIIHLNDSDRWPRERIAGWLEGLGL